MRTKSSWAAILGLGLLLAGASSVMASPGDADSDLQKSIRADLEHLHVKNLGVEVLGWEVTLTGTVDSLADAEQATKITSEKAGVKEVFNDLQIVWVPDDVVQSSVVEAIEKDRQHYTVFDLVHVAVADGRVYLSGHAMDARESAAIEKTVTKVRGVSSVDNEIDTSPMSHADEELQTSVVFGINRALTPYVMAGPSIHVMVKDGHVSLSGFVDGNAAKEAVASAAEGVDGVASVTNAIRSRSS